VTKRREHNQETWILFLDLVKAFDTVPRELLWRVLNKLGVPDKLVSILKAMHKNVEVLFEVDGVKKKLNSIIGVKQGDLLGPELFTFYMSAVLETWRSLHSYDLCIMRSKEDFILTGRNHKTGGKNLNGKRFTEFAVSDSEYADDTAIPFTSRSDAEIFIPLLMEHFRRWGLEVHAGSYSPHKDSKTRCSFVHDRFGLTKTKKLSMTLMVKARVRGGLAMCISAFSGCGAGAPRRKFWGYIITFN